MLVTLAAIQFTTALDFMVIMPLAPQFSRVFSLSAQQFGWLISAYTSLRRSPASPRRW